MCGIAGVFFQGAKGAQAGKEMAGVLGRLARRGPDGEGISRGNGWVFGHRRLAVIDLLGGSQPIEDCLGALTYNGELYNYRELRDLLRREGQSFTTASDTEVVLKAWRAWGPACLKRFNGMFAFAVYDGNRDSIFLARDPLGIKPLFYYAGKGGFYFASTMAALLAFEEVPATADPAGISHYLTTTHVVMGSRTLVKGVCSLEPGSWLEVRRDFVGKPPRQVRYRTLPAQRREAISFEQAAAQTRELVHDSVRSQLISDVPLGGFLSGGIDSTIIASQASKLCAFNAYSVGYQHLSSAGESFHEWPYIREAAASYGIGCKEIVLEPSDYPTDWKFLIAEKGQPLSTPNEIGIYRLASALRREYTVALSGEGADEIFGGYTEACFSVVDFIRSRQLDRFDPGQREILSSALKRMYGTDRFNSLLDHFLRLIAHMNFGVKFNLLQPKWQEELKNDELLIRHYADRFAAMKNCTPFDAYMRLILEKNLQTLLFRLDSSTMAASVEGRVPFTDPRLVDLLFSLPDHYKMDWSEEANEAETLTLNTIEAAARGLIRSKMLLREAFADVVPQSILTRRKMSFPTPFLEWFAGSMRAMVEESLRQSPFARGWLRPESVELLLANLEKPAYGMMAWPLMNLCLWQEEMGISWD